MALLDLQARVTEELHADYLLIDTRSGVTDLGGLATTVLADSVVCLFSETQESLEGTLVVGEAIKGAPRLKDQLPVRFVPVLNSRSGIPAGGRFPVEVGRLLGLDEGEKTRGDTAPLSTAIDEEATDQSLRLTKPSQALFGVIFPGVKSPRKRQ